jgi:hypothetical protein
MLLQVEGDISFLMEKDFLKMIFLKRMWLHPLSLRSVCKLAQDPTTDAKDTLY